MLKLKNKNKINPKFMHVEISSAILVAWKKFRKSQGMFRGPLEERALVEYMERHGSNGGKPSKEEAPK
jgi:hypothetical protein